MAWIGVLGLNLLIYLQYRGQSERLEKSRNENAELRELLRAENRKNRELLRKIEPIQSGVGRRSANESPSQRLTRDLIAPDQTVQPNLQ